MRLGLVWVGNVGGREGMMREFVVMDEVDGGLGRDRVVERAVDG